MRCMVEMHSLAIDILSFWDNPSGVQASEVQVSVDAGMKKVCYVIQSASTTSTV